MVVASDRGRTLVESVRERFQEIAWTVGEIPGERSLRNLRKSK